MPEQCSDVLLPVSHYSTQSVDISLLPGNIDQKNRKEDCQLAEVNNEGLNIILKMSFSPIL